jgi:hypothetical protein
MEQFDDGGVPEEWHERIATMGRFAVSAFTCIMGAAVANVATTGNISNRFNLLCLSTWSAITIGGEAGRNVWRASANLFRDPPRQQG